MISNIWFDEDPTGEIVNKTKEVLHHETFKVVMLALAEIGVAWILSNLAKRWCQKVADKSLNKGIMTFIGSFLSIAIKAIGVIIALDQLGVSMNVIVGAMSGLGVGVALALKSNMASVASGLQILMTKPFKVGDYISIGTNYGTVSAIELTFTTLLTNDNETVIIPNNNFLSNNMVNYTRNNSLSCVLDFPCNSTEIRYYLDRLAYCAMDCPLVLQDPQPVARVDHYLSGATADLKLIYYCKTDQYWETYDQVTRAVSGLFQQSYPSTAPDQKDGLLDELKEDAAKARKEDGSDPDDHSPANEPSVKQTIKQIVSDILPIPLPNMPSQKPLKTSIQQLFKTAVQNKEEAKAQEIPTQNNVETVLQQTEALQQKADTDQKDPQTVEDGQKDPEAASAKDDTQSTGSQTAQPHSGLDQQQTVEKLLEEADPKQTKKDKKK